MLRMLPVGFIITSLGFLSMAAYDYVTRHDAPGVVIDNPERELPEASTETPIPVVFPIHNPTGHTIRIIGLAEC